jgi:hypothetical protein
VELFLAAGMLVLGPVLAATVLPVLMFNYLNKPIWGLTCALITVAGATVDYLYNWSGIEYPIIFLGIFASVYPLTLAVGGLAIALALNKIFEVRSY